MRALRGDDGSAVVELAPAALVLIIFLAVMVTAGRLTIGALAVHDAARDAARQASIARDPQSAVADAETSAQAALAGDQLNCTPTVSVDTTGFLVPAGQPASVSATVTCNVSMAGLTGIPGVPGSRLITATFTSPLDVFRGR